MMLQLANKSIKYPYGVVKDVLVKVDKFIFPVDFLWWTWKKTRMFPWFLANFSWRLLIDVDDGKLKVRAQDNEVTSIFLKV